MRGEANQNVPAMAKQAVVGFIVFIANRFFFLVVSCGKAQGSQQRKIAWKRDQTWILRKFKRGAFERRSNDVSSKIHVA